MSSALGLFIRVALLLIGVYGLRAAGAIEARASSILYGCLLIAFGLGFLVFCLLVFLNGGATPVFAKWGPKTLGPDDPDSSHFAAWIFLVFFAGICIKIGWDLLIKGDTDR